MESVVYWAGQTLKDNIPKEVVKMEVITLYVCMCGKIRICGNWEWSKTRFSSFVQRLVKRDIRRIDFAVLTCNTCLKKQLPT